MSNVERYEYGTPLCSVQEGRKLIVEGCDPNTIRDELAATNFTLEGSKYVKRRPRLRARSNATDSNGSQILRVRIVEDTLHVTASDVVGIVRLIPGMSVQIEPKVEWDHVIRMLLTLYDIDRTQSYYGVPLEELIDSDVEAARVLAILALNYVHGVRIIRRKGFTRDLHIRRRDGFEGLGSVDVERTLMNHASGNPEPTWVETHIEYDNPVNESIHMAGKLLLRLLQQGRQEHAHPRRDVLLSMVHQELSHLEQLGVESSQRRIGLYRRLSLDDLPRQRHYYNRAFHASQSILSSSLLGQVGSGPEELLVDYALSMNTLFQDYSQRVLERALDSIRQLDHLENLLDVACEPEYPIYPFTERGEGRYEPDHLFTDGEDTFAVLDSKYYQEGKNPASSTGSRSRMFAYAYLMQTNRMAFLCPQYRPMRLSVQRVDAEVEIVSPDGEFSCDEYERQIRTYLLETLAQHFPELQVFSAVDEYHLCLNDATEEQLSQILDTTGPFSISNPVTFADKIINAIAFSQYGPSKPDLENQGQWTKSRIRDTCAQTNEDGLPKYPQHETTAVPVYDPSGGDDHGVVTLYFIRDAEDDVEVSQEGPITLL